MSYFFMGLAIFGGSAIIVVVFHLLITACGWFKYMNDNRYMWCSNKYGIKFAEELLNKRIARLEKKLNINYSVDELREKANEIEEWEKKVGKCK